MAISILLVSDYTKVAPVAFPPIIIIIILHTHDMPEKLDAIKKQKKKKIKHNINTVYYRRCDVYTTAANDRKTVSHGGRRHLIRFTRLKKNSRKPKSDGL